jgi:integrase
MLKLQNRATQTRTLNRLTELRARRLDKPGRHADGGGLYLDVGGSGNKHWCFIFTRDGRRRELGLGPYPAVALSAAREKAQECRAALHGGKDPAAVREAAKEALTLADCIAKYVKLQPQWSESTHRQWRPHRVVVPALLPKSVAAISKADVVEMLKARTPVMRPRVQKQLERIFDWAIERGFRADPNPVPRKLRDYFEARPRTKNHPAMPWADLPQFLRELRACSDLPAACLELQILCCLRPRETRLARWAEVDFENALWTVPASRMKGRAQHRVPLSQPALTLLRRLWEWRASELIFPPVTGSAMCAEAVAARIPRDRFLTPTGVPGHAHGFRASFSMWCADHSIDRDVREKCLAHKEKDKTVEAYQQSDLLDLRRPVMEKWAAFLGGGDAA